MKLIERQILDIARSYIDVKYFYKGRGHGGLDCAGLCVLAYNLPDIFKYNDNSSLKEIILQLEPYFSRVTNIEDIDNEDLLLFNSVHTAIYCRDKNTIIHSYRKVGRVVEEKLTKFWKDRIHSSYRRK